MTAPRVQMSGKYLKSPHPPVLYTDNVVFLCQGLPMAIYEIYGGQVFALFERKIFLRQLVPSSDQLGTSSGPARDFLNKQSSEDNAM